MVEKTPQIKRGSGQWALSGARDKAHVRRKFFDIQAATDSPLARAALERIGALYAIEADIRGKTPDERRAVRQAHAGPLLADLHQWLIATTRKLSKKSDLAGAIHYALTRWTALCRYRDDGSLEIDNNAAERSLRAVAVGVSLCTSLSSV
jgi:transposase